MDEHILWRIGVHESAHFIVGSALGARCSVDLVPDETGGLGHCAVEWPRSAGAHERAAFLIAGAAAELRLGVDMAAVEEAARTDLTRLDALGVDVEAAWAAADAILAARWPDLLAMARRSVVHRLLLST